MAPRSGSRSAIRARSSASSAPTPTWPAVWSRVGASSRGWSCSRLVRERRLQRPVLARAGPAPSLHVARLELRPAPAADAAIVYLAAAAAVLEHDGPAVGVVVAIAPLQQRDDHRPEVDAFVGQPVLVALGTLLVATALEDALLDEPLQPRLQHVARDAEAALEVVEAADAEERVAEDEHRPALAHDLERPGD